MYSSLDFNKSLAVFVYAYMGKIGKSFVTAVYTNLMFVHM